MCKRVKCEVGKRNVLKSNMNIKIMDVSDVVFPQGKVKKELKYYYRHREEILVETQASPHPSEPPSAASRPAAACTDVSSVALGAGISYVG